MLNTYPATLSPDVLPTNRRRGGQPSNRNALKHGLYAVKNPAPLPSHLSSSTLSQPGLDLDPSVIEAVILNTQVKLRDYLLAWSPPRSLRALLAWSRPVERAVKTIEKLTLASARRRYALRHLGLAVEHPLELLRWGFRQEGITRDADSFREKSEISDLNSTALPGDIRPLTFLTDAQWAVLAPLIPQSAINNQQSSIHKGRPPSDPRRLLDAIFWRFAHHARWVDLPFSLPKSARPAEFSSGVGFGEGGRRPGGVSMLTCRRYYRRLFLSGRLYTIYKALYKDYLARSGTTLRMLVEQGCFISIGHELVLADGIPETWENRTALLFLQESWRLSCRLLREIDREHHPRSPLVHLPPTPIMDFPFQPSLLANLRSLDPGAGQPVHGQSGGETDQGTCPCENMEARRRSAQYRTAAYSFREKGNLSDLNSSLSQVALSGQAFFASQTQGIYSTIQDPISSNPTAHSP